MGTEPNAFYANRRVFHRSLPPIGARKRQGSLDAMRAHARDTTLDAAHDFCGC